MDPATTEFYKNYVKHGAIAAEAPESAISRYFESAFEAGSKILDIGSGSGRDLALLRAKGFDAYGIEPNDAMRAFALQKHPDLLTRLQPGALPLSGMPFGGNFDGVVCSAVMMHIPEDQFRESCESICRVLKPDGRVLFSLPRMRSDLLADERDQDGRFFRNHPPAIVDAVLKSLGFSRIELGGEATSAYPDVTWSISLFRRAQAPGATTTGI
jgi:SAM-dependent methyltransferase